MPHAETLEHIADFNSPVFYRDWSRNLTRLWLPALTASEFALVMFIFDRTVGWGKEWETIPQSHFVGGVENRDGKRYGGGTGLSERTVRSGLHSLADYGCIRTRPGTHYGAGCIDYALNFEWRPPMMKLPRHERTARVGGSLPTPRCTRVQTSEVKPPSRADFEDETPAKGRQILPVGAASFAGVRGKFCPLRGEKGIGAKEETEILLAEPAASASIGEKAEDVLTAHREGRSTTRRTALGTALQATNPTVNDLEMIWKAAHGEIFTDTPHVGWKLKEKAALKRVAKTWAESRNAATCGEFIDWSVRYWLAVMQDRFGWMTNPPAPQFPAVMFFVKFVDKFIGAWQERESLQARTLMAPRERMLHDLRLRGVDEETAKAKVEERFGQGDALAKIQAAETRLKTKMLAAQRQEEYTSTRRRVVAAVRASAAPMPTKIPIPAADSDKEFVDQGGFGGFEEGQP